MKMKMIQVRWKTHLQAKRQAKERGISMRDYIQMILDQAKFINPLESKDNK